MWYVLAAANALSGDSELIAGTQLRVPEVGVSKNDASTFKPYNPNEIVGSTAPGLPYIAPPSNVSCKQTIGIILAAAIRVVSQFVGSIVSKMPVIGFLGPIIGAHGEVQAQLYEKLFDLRQHFDWGAVAAAAVTTLIPTGTTTAAKIALGAARAAASYTISYGVNRMMGKDPSFSLRSMAAATATGAVSGALAAKVPSGVTDGLVSGTVKGIAFDWSRVSMEAVLSSTVQNVAVSALNKGITQAITGERQSWDPAAMLADAFGNALGNTISRAITPIVDSGQQQASTPHASASQPTSTGYIQGQTASGFGMRFGVYPDEDAMGKMSVGTSSNSEPLKELDRVTVTGVYNAEAGGYYTWNWNASNRAWDYTGQFVKADRPRVGPPLARYTGQHGRPGGAPVQVNLKQAGPLKGGFVPTAQAIDNISQTVSAVVGDTQETLNVGYSLAELSRKVPALQTLNKAINLPQHKAAFMKIALNDIESGLEVYSGRAKSMQQLAEQYSHLPTGFKKLPVISKALTPLDYASYMYQVPAEGSYVQANTAYVVDSAGSWAATGGGAYLGAQAGLLASAPFGGAPAPVLVPLMAIGGGALGYFGWDGYISEPIRNWGAMPAAPVVLTPQQKLESDLLMQGIVMRRP